MSDGFVLPPGAGRRIEIAGMTLKVGTQESDRWSVFEADVQPGFDVGAHVHARAEELFYVLDGELDLLAFEPTVRTADGWRGWTSASGATVARGGPGSLMYVPPGCPHAFANPGPTPVRMLFLFAPAGHELYLQEMGGLISGPTPPNQATIKELRARYDIEQLTPVVPGRRLRQRSFAVSAARTAAARIRARRSAFAVRSVRASTTRRPVPETTLASSPGRSTSAYGTAKASARCESETPCGVPNIRSNTDGPDPAPARSANAACSSDSKIPPPSLFTTTRHRSGRGSPGPIASPAAS